MSASLPTEGPSSAANGVVTPPSLGLIGSRRLWFPDALPVQEARLALAIVAALVAIADPAAAAARWVAPLLFMYAGLCVLALVRFKRERLSRLSRTDWQVDAAIYAIVVLGTGGTSSGLCIFLIVPVLVASLQAGFPSGAAVVVAIGVVLFGSLARADEPIQTWLIPLAEVLLVGLVISRWSSFQVDQQRRARFHDELGELSRGTQSFDQTLQGLTHLLQEFLQVERCIVLLADAENESYFLQDAHFDRAPVARTDQISREFARPLLTLPREAVVVYRSKRLGLRAEVCRSYDPDGYPSGKAEKTVRAAMIDLRNLLEADHFSSAPLPTRDVSIGRIYLVGGRSDTFGRELRFLRQALGQIALVIENRRLLVRLAEETARVERDRISRDLHDGTIQPYIGLKLGLEALRRRVLANQPIAEHVDELITNASSGILELRRYVDGLRGEELPIGRCSLLATLRSEAQSFTAFSGISVIVLAVADTSVTARVLDELVYVVREGLSNVRRHTSARRVELNFQVADDRLIISIINDNPIGHKPAPFVPRSLNKRARQLGGHVRVGLDAEGRTVVALYVPH